MCVLVKVRCMRQQMGPSSLLKKAAQSKGGHSLNGIETR